MVPSKKFRSGSNRDFLYKLASLTGLSVATIERWIRGGDFKARFAVHIAKQSGWIIIKDRQNISRKKL
jgi:hypothetical protein